MEVTGQKIVWYEGRIQVLFITNNGYFITSNGAFGQRETYIEEIYGETVKKILYDTSIHFSKTSKLINQ